MELLPGLFLFLLSLLQRAAMAASLALGVPWRAAAGILSGALADALPALLLGALLARRPLKPAAAALRWYSAALSALLALDAVYFLIARNRIDSVLLRNIEPLSLRAHLFSRYGLYLLLALVAAGAAAWAAARLSASPARKRPSWTPAWLAAAAVLLAGALSLVPPLPEASSHEGFINFCRNRGLRIVGAPSLVSLASAMNGPRHELYKGTRLDYTDEEREALASMGLKEDSAGIPAGPRRKLRRIVIVAAESLSRMYIGKWNPRLPQGVTPFLDSLAGKYPSADNYWGGGMPTEEAVYSILLSRPLYDVSSVSSGRLTPLFSVLRDAGWRSVILRGHTHFYQDAVSLYPRLYAPDRFIGAEEIAGGTAPVDLNWGFHDGEVLRHALDVLEEEKGGPVAMLINLMDNHPPYYSAVPAEELPGAVAASGSKLARSLYSTDRALKEFFSGLRERGLFDGETLVIVTADHRPAYGEMPSFMDTDDYMNWRIPLILASGDGAEPLSVGRQAAGSHVDLAPTIAGLLGLEAPAGWWGRSLLEPGRTGTALGSAEDFLLAQSPGYYFWITYAEADREAQGEPARKRAFRKWVNNRLIGTTERVRAQSFDAEKGRWVRHSF